MILIRKILLYVEFQYQKLKRKAHLRNYALQCFMKKTFRFA